MIDAIAAWERATRRAERRRWLLSVIAIALLGGAATAALPPRSAEPPALASAAIVVELAPLAQSPTEPNALPPGPVQVENTATAAPPEHAPLPELPPASDPQAYASRAAEPEPVQTQAETALATAQPSDTPPAVLDSAPPSAKIAPAPVAAAPQTASVSQATLAAAQLSFQQRLLAHLERHKRYPRAAQQRRQQGVPYVRFTMDRKGHVLSAALAHASGHALLDAEALALFERAAPLPALPDEIEAAQLELIVPVEFFIARR